MVAAWMGALGRTVDDAAPSGLALILIGLGVLTLARIQFERQ